MMNAIAESAERLVGTPFRHQGRKAGVGLDCVGVVYAACLEAGVPVRDFRAYGRMPAPEELDRELASRFRRVSPADAQPGDVIVIGGKCNGRHVGVMVSADSYVEARAGRSVTRSRFDRGSLVSAFRVTLHG